MSRGIFNLALKSVKYYRKQVVYQFLIILLLCAVITGSLMTGRSVRASLKKTALEKIGNAEVYISSGLRYFDKKLVDRFSANTGFNCTGILELNGSSQGLISQKTSNTISIYAVEDDFFNFHGLDTLKIGKGEVIVNMKLATALGIAEGDEVIIRFRDVTDIPADAPFAPSEGESESIVLKARKIIDAENMGNFSLTISQIPPANIFLNLSDLEEYYSRAFKLNRLLIGKNGKTPGEIYSALKNSIEPSDAGLHVRMIKATATAEIISDRVFIDEALLYAIREIIPEASPVITYLANSTEKNGKVNPYSFVSAIPDGLVSEAPAGSNVVINKWLSEDIGAVEGDTIKMSWYAPDSLNQLIERSAPFRITRIVPVSGVWADSMLMPDFPGIAGSESCSDWDAGIPVKTNLIRDKDEDYWDKYRGLPKAFINYEKGKELWASNYGPATAIRFSKGLAPGDITSRLRGFLDPAILGFTINDIYNESIRAAENSVDFGTLFLSLGFFLILASIVLLSFTVSWYFELKRKEITMLFSLGFKNSIIRRMLLFESSIIALAGCVAGGIAGFFVNTILVKALNSVWTGAVTTNTLVSVFDTGSLVAGFLVSFIMIFIFMLIKTRLFLKQLSERGTKHQNIPSSSKNMWLLTGAATLNIIAFALIIVSENRISFSFLAGTLLFVTILLAWRQYLLAGKKKRSNLSRQYYSFYPSHAVTPALFIAAGIFAVFITSVNRKNFNSSVDDRASGSGGYLLWTETTLPVTDDVNTTSGKLNLGLDDEIMSGLRFIPMKKAGGNDASCLNLNHITAPPLLGVDPSEFHNSGAFSFAKTIYKERSPWLMLNENATNGAIYGIADQTVLDWGLKLSVGDTIILRSENGQPLNIIIAAGLQSSVFQGYVIIGMQNFQRFYPSVSGHSVFLADGQAKDADSLRSILNERLVQYGGTTERTADRLATFYEITNTYLTVFGVFGGLGMITGIAGLGFVLLKTYNRRRREFALMLASGFTAKRIRKMIFTEQVKTLAAGVVAGVLPAFVATLPSLQSNREVPWLYLGTIILAIFLTGLLAVFISIRPIKEEGLIGVLRKE